MVSNRCKEAVKADLKRFGLHFIFVDLGEIEVMEDLSEEQFENLKTALSLSGFELMDNKKAVLIEKIKNAIIEMVHQNDETSKKTLSSFLSEKLNQDYTYMSNLFSSVQGMTIEQFSISHKIKRIKELILLGKLNMTEIAWKMNYSSVAHLSTQFKMNTGLTPSHFKQLLAKNTPPSESATLQSPFEL
jgi:AraC-like DNA-binding protein